MTKENNSKKQLKNIFFDWGVPIIIALVAVAFIYQFLFFNVKVPTPSMSPTIEPGDKLFVTRIHNTSKIQRREIMVFNSKELDERLINRVIGLPGDHIEIDFTGPIYINGKKLNEDYVKYLAGKSNISFHIPKGKFFMLGDNRDGSFDARY